jgi:hypothetical protein
MPKQLVRLASAWASIVSLSISSIPCAAAFPASAARMSWSVNTRVCSFGAWDRVGRPEATGVSEVARAAAAGAAGAVRFMIHPNQPQALEGSE